MIEFPWPHSCLNPNHNAHKMIKAKKRAKQKEECFYLTKALKVEKEDKHTEMHVTFFPPDKRHRDLDNTYAMCKGMIDGMCMALGMDDKNLRPVKLDWGEKVMNGKVVIELF